MTKRRLAASFRAAIHLRQPLSRTRAKTTPTGQCLIAGSTLGRVVQRARLPSWVGRCNRCLARPRVERRKKSLLNLCRDLSQPLLSPVGAFFVVPSVRLQLFNPILGGAELE